MIDRTKIIKTILQRIQKIPSGHYLELRTYKRNRSVLIVKNTDDDYTLIEDGYYKEKTHITANKLEKLLHVIMRKEFPRSHKIRLYGMGKFTEEGAIHVKRKIL